MITSPFLYKCIMTFYLVILIFLIEIIINQLLPLDIKGDGLFTETVENKFLITSIIGWMKILLVCLWLFVVKLI